MRGWCERPGAARIGFGELVGRVLLHARPDADADVEALHLLSQLRGIPGAHRAQSTRAALPGSAGTPAARRRRAAHRSVRAAQSRAASVPVLEDGALTLTQSLAIIEYLEDTHPCAGAAAGRTRGRARAGARAGTEHRLRHPSAQQPAGVALSQVALAIDDASAAPNGRAIGSRSDFERARAPAGSARGRRRLLLRRYADAGRLLPDAAGVQCAARESARSSRSRAFGGSTGTACSWSRLRARHPGPRQMPSSRGERLRLQDFLPYRLSVAANAVSRLIARAYERQFGLKNPQWRLLAVLAEEGATDAANAVRSHGHGQGDGHARRAGSAAPTPGAAACQSRGRPIAPPADHDRRQTPVPSHRAIGAAPTRRSCSAASAAPRSRACSSCCGGSSRRPARAARAENGHTCDGRRDMKIY